MFLQHTPTVEFNPANRDHRNAVRDFMKRKAWADTSVRFSYNPTYGSVAAQVQTRLLEWYIQQEENRKKKISEKE